MPPDPERLLTKGRWRDRRSLALDLMEAVRPLVDSSFSHWLTQRTLRKRDFVESRQGACRLTPRLAAGFAETLPAWRRHVAPVVEQTDHLPADAAGGRVPRLTPLTRANQRAAWDSCAPGRRVRQARGSTLVLPATCRGCGGPIPDRRRHYRDQRRREQSARHAVNARDRAADVLASLRAEQRDPAHGGRAAQVRGLGTPRISAPSAPGLKNGPIRVSSCARLRSPSR